MERRHRLLVDIDMRGEVVAGDAEVDDLEGAPRRVLREGREQTLAEGVLPRDTGAEDEGVSDERDPRDLGSRAIGDLGSTEPALVGRDDHRRAVRRVVDLRRSEAEHAARLAGPMDDVIDMDEGDSGLVDTIESRDL